MNVKFTLNDLQRRRVEDHLALVEQVLRRSRAGRAPAVSLSLPEALWFTAAEMLRLSSTAATALPLVRHKGVLFQL